MFVRAQSEYKQILLQRKLTEMAKVFRQQPTAAESKLWQCLRRSRLNNMKFRRQHPLFRYIVDFYCYEYKMIIEVDGLVHDYQMPQDAVRDQLLSQHGFYVLRFTNEQVLHNTKFVLDTIRTFPLLQKERVAEGRERS